MRYQQDLQVRLRERLRRLMVADLEDASHEVRLVTVWITQQPALGAILAEAEQAEPGPRPGRPDGRARARRRGLSRHFRWPSHTEAGRAGLIWQLMRRVTADDADGTDSKQILMELCVRCQR